MSGKQIEIAKSWFMLAQIFIIAAGFMFASSGLAWTNATQIQDSGLKLAEKSTSIDCNQINNISIYQELIKDSLDYYSESTLSNLNLWKIYLKIGGILSFLAILFWGLGKYKLNRIE